MEFLKIESIAHANRWAVVPVAPGDHIAVFQPQAAGIVAVDKIANLLIFTKETDRLGVDLPVNAVLAESPVKLHFSRGIVDAKNTGKFAFIGYDGAVKNAVRSRQGVAGDNRIFLITPHQFLTVFWAILPGDIGPDRPKDSKELVWRYEKN